MKTSLNDSRQNLVNYTHFIYEVLSYLHYSSKYDILVCLLMRIIASFLRYTGYLNFINDPIGRVLLLILAHVLLPRCLCL